VADDSRLRTFFQSHPLVTFVVGELGLIFMVVNSLTRLHYLATGQRSLDPAQTVLALVAAALPLAGSIAVAIATTRNPPTARGIKAALVFGLLAAVIVGLPGRYSHQYYFVSNIQVIGDAYMVTMGSVAALYLVRIKFWQGGRTVFAPLSASSNSSGAESDGAS
jgi:hypothetical protein